MTLTIHYSNQLREPSTLCKLTQIMMNSDKSLEFIGEVNISDDIDNPMMHQFTGKIPASEIDSYFITHDYVYVIENETHKFKSYYTRKG